MIYQLNDTITIHHNLSNYSVTIQFKYASPTLIKSIVKPRLICDAVMDDTFTNIRFTATKVCTLTQYIKYKPMRIQHALTLFKNLFEQLQYLNTYEQQTFIEFRPEEILVIDNNTCIFLGCDYISNMSEEKGNELCLISCPFSKTNGFFSPEMQSIAILPAYVHYKTAYYSIAIVYLYSIYGEKKFGNYDKSHEDVIKLLNHKPLLETPIYWLLKKCLYENPNERIVLFN